MLTTEHRVCRIRPYLIMFLSAMLRAFYVNYISIYKMQHDGGFPYARTGHLSYVTYLLTEGHLQDFDPRTADQFWHPPLHHVLSAGLLRISWKLFPAQEGNLEIMQLLPYLYITAVIWVFWKMLREYAANTDPALRDAILALTAFQPTFVILSASVNNDALALLMSMLVLYAALRWYRKPGLKNAAVVGAALGIGLSSKLAVALMFIPAALMVLLKSLRDRRVPLRDMGMVALIGLPTGLWWYLRNLIRFGVPLNYVWNIEGGEFLTQNLSRFSAAERILFADPRQFSYENTYVQYEGELLERNPLTGLIKTTAVELWTWTYSDGGFKFVSWLLVLLTTLFAILVFAGSLQFVSAGGKDQIAMDGIERAAILFVIAADLVSYYVFCFRYPYVWSMDIRYIETILPMGGLVLLSLAERTGKLKKAVQLLSWVQVVLTVIFFATAPGHIL
ncbi:MAG: glycosyltransferase family 39 protein [Lachnospiraceae bacterium]|nr:glycosyltransferase family 39 protein [Lachnospiraceae bacterium]